MDIKFYGHSCFEINNGDHTILIDPFIRPNELAKDVDINKIKPDFILVSHGHEDHIYDCIDIAKNSGAQVIANFEVVSWLSKNGIQNNHPMNIGGSVKLEDYEVKMVNAIHSSGLPDGTYGGNPGGFIIQSKGKTIYYSGDTALTYDIKLYAEQFKFDSAILCIGDNFTMDANEAATAANWLGVKQVIGMHYDTFPYIKINHQEAIDAFKNKGVTLNLLSINTSIKI